MEDRRKAKGKARFLRLTRPGGKAALRGAVESLESRVCLSADYAAGTPITTSQSNEFIASADFNGDLNRDLVLSSYNGTRLTVLLGSGDGTFTAAAPLPLAHRPDFVTTGDLNADGKVDLVTANYDASSVTVLLGNGDGTFGTAISYASGAGTRMIVLGDFTGDGKLDAAVGKSTGTTLTILPGDGTGAFAAAINTTLTTRPTDLATGDFNKDGKLDLAATNYFTDRVVILTGNGNGTFAQGTAYTTGSGPASVATTDVNADGNLDLVTANYLAGTLSIFLGAASGTFTNTATLTAGSGVTHVVSGDLDGNNTADLVVANGSANTAGVFLNTAGSYGAMYSYSTASSPRSVTIGNFNGGKLDIAVANEFSSTVTVLLETGIVVPPVAVISGSYTVAEGGSIVLNGSSSTGEGLSYQWDLDGDGIFGETGSSASRGNETGATPTLSAVGLDGPSTHIIRLRVTDNISQTSAVASAGVAVTNVAPTVSISGGASASEGSTYTLSLSHSDVGVDSLTQWVINWGDGTTSTLAGSATTATKVYPDNGNYVISATATDEDGTYTTNTRAVSVTNVAPSVSISGAASTNEGSTYTLSLSHSDVGADSLVQWLINWGDGTTSTLSGSANSATKVYLDNGSYVISATATDEDGTYTTNTRSVSVANVSPTLTISGNASVFEGSAYTLNLSAQDPGADTLTQWVINWGDGTTTTVSGSTTSVTKVYADNANRTIIATATDEDGTHTSNALSLSVANVAPTLHIDGQAAVIQGNTFTLELSRTDPGTDTLTQWLIDWGNGSTSTLAGSATTATFTYNVVGQYTIRATAIDEDGTWTANTHFLNVASNLPTPPTATVGTGYVIAEGGTVVLSAAGSTGTNVGYLWDLDGDGLFGETGNAASRGNELGLTVTLVGNGLDGPGTYLARVRVVDSAGQFATATASVQVNNVSPTVAISGPSAINEGSTYTLTLSKSDPGADTISQWVINWGDGTTSTLPGSATTASKVFADNAVRTITATATDDDGTYSTNSVNVTVGNVAPTLLISGPGSATEGSTYTLTLSKSDPGADTISQWVINWGDGTTSTLPGSATTASKVFADNAVRTITATATDEDATYTANSLSVTISNVAPLVSVLVGSSTPVGSAFTLGVASIDPGTDTISSWLINWGDGTTESLDGSQRSFTRTYQAAGTYIISIRAIDEDGSWLVANQQATIVAQAPTVTATGTASISENTPFLLTLSYSHPSGRPITSWLVDWGDGTTAVLDPTATSTTHLWLDDGEYEVLVTAINADGSWEAAPLPVVVGNTPPVISTAVTSAEGTTASLSFAYNDDGRTTPLFWQIDWGDGTVETLPGSATNASRNYGINGEFEVEVIAIDEDGEWSLPARQVDLTTPAGTSAMRTPAATITRGSNWRFQVVYSGEGGIDLTSITADNLVASSEDGTELPVTLASKPKVQRDGSVLVTYRLDAPNGRWSYNDNGTYAVELLDDSVFTSSGRALDATTLGQVTVRVIPRDAAGTTALKPRSVAVPAIGKSRVYTDVVADFDTEDAYRLKLSKPAAIALSLTGLRDDADLEILDANGNVLASSATTGNADEFLSMALDRGTYFTRVRFSGERVTEYQLTMTGQAPAPIAQAATVPNFMKIAPAPSATDAMFDSATRLAA